MKLAGLLCLAILSSSCIRNIEQAGMKAHKDVSGECELIRKQGNIFEILKAINSDTKNVLSLLENKPRHNTEALIHGLAEEISKNSDRVIELSKEEWNTPYLRQTLQWIMSDKDFGSRNLYVWDPKITQVYYLGQERPDLIPRFEIDQFGNDIKINYVNDSSVLEFCQLSETMMVVLEIKSGSFRKPKMKYFNLHVNLEK